MLSRWLISGEFRTLAGLLALAMLAPAPIWAQAPSAGEGPPAFKPEELDQIAAPIALYPDPLVAQILMASTYPLEIVQAARFARANPSLTGAPLDDELKKQTWDDSVKALVGFPQVIAMMSDKLDWTQKLGDAFLGQQKDLMDAVQRPRAKAQAQGSLKDTPQQKIVVELAPRPPWWSSRRPRRRRRSSRSSPPIPRWSTSRRTTRRWSAHEEDPRPVPASQARPPRRHRRDDPAPGSPLSIWTTGQVIGYAIP